MLVHLLKDIFKNKTERDQDDLCTAHVLIENSQLVSAREVLDALIGRSPQNAKALLARATVQRLLNNPSGAIADLEQSLASGLPADQGACHFELTLCWRMLGNDAKALAHCETARKLDPGSVPIFFLLTQLRLPGDYYFDVFSRIVGHLKPRTYVEIGVFEGASLKLVKASKAIVGVDPNPQIDWALEPNTKVFAMTSDDFFAKHDLVAELGKRQVDLAFIDGMHQFEFALRDFANLERFCRPDSVILVHDCYPVDAESSGREPRSSRWSGDVWRLIVLLKKYRPDLLIHTIATAPTGLAVIQNLNPASTFLLDNQQRLYEEFIAMDYAYLDEEKPQKLNLLPNHWPTVKSVIRQRHR